LNSRNYNCQKVYEIGNEVVVLRPIKTPETDIIDEECFPICIGCKIRLKRNFDLKGKICSGSTGIIEGILSEEFESDLIIVVQQLSKA
jgi:hypothetical protein